MLGNRPSRIIVIFLLVALFTMAGCGGEQDAPPSPGTIIDFTNITPTSLTMNWTKATDDNTLQPYLEYKVVYSKADNFGDVDAVLAWGVSVPITIVNSEGREEEVTWVQDNTSIDVKDLDDGIEYFFTVVVRDKYWNAALYIPDSVKTVDITAPEAGNAGLLEISNEANASGNVSLTLRWTKASDNNTSGPSVLEYRVVYSTSNNVGNVNSALENDMTPEDKQVWTTDISTTADIEEDYISGLPHGTCHYFNVLVRDEAGNTGIYQTISQTPEAGDSGTLTISDEEIDRLTLNWTKATDSENSPSFIEYRVVYSSSDNIKNVEDAEDNDEAGFDWETDIDSKENIVFPTNGNYFLNVLVRDVAGIKTIYKTITNAPTPGNNGRLGSENIEETSFTLTWELAIDSGSEDEDDLAYQVFQSLTNNISTIAEIEANGGAPVGQGQGIDSFDVSGLDTATDYYFNVLVTDATGHKAAYNMMNSTPSDREATSLTRVFFMVPESVVASSSSPLVHEQSDLEREDAVLEVDNNMGDLVVWLDGSDVNGDGTLFQGRPETWEDKSMYGNSAVQMLIEKRPVLVDSFFLNNRQVMRFDEIRGDTMTIDLYDSWGGQADAYTVFIVADFRGISPDVADELSEGSCFSSVDAGGNIWGLETFFTGDDYFFAFTDGKDFLYSSLVVPENPAIVSIVSRENSVEGPYIALDVNGEKEIFRGVMNQTGLKSFRLGAFVPDKEDTVAHFSGDIAEFVVFKRTLTEDEQIKIRSYLSEKWGLP